MGGGSEQSSKLNDGAVLGTCKDSDGVRIGSVSERFGVGNMESTNTCPLGLASQSSAVSS